MTDPPPRKRRPGAGRKPGDYKYGEATRTMRVPVSLMPAVRALAEAHGQGRRARRLPVQPALLPAAGAAPLLPLFTSRVAAGQPAGADEHAERVDLFELLVRAPETTFLVPVLGESMSGAGIHSGDLLVVDRALPPGDGRIVIALLDGEVTVKRLRRARGRLLLLPENPDFAPIEVDPEQGVVVQGVVTRVIRSV